MIPEANGSTLAYIVQFKEIDSSPLPQGFYHKTERTDRKVFVNVKNLEKMFHIENDDEVYFLELVNFFCHN